MSLVLQLIWGWLYTYINHHRGISLKTAGPDHYQFLIDIGHSSLTHIDGYVNTLPPERIPGVRFSEGLNALGIAVGHLMLDQVEDARSWFRKTSEYFFEANRQYDTVMAERRTLECALFCGDKGFRIQVAQKIQSREGQIKPMEHSYVMFLKHMILNEQTEAFAYADESMWLSRATMKKRGSYGTLQETCKALACRPLDEFVTTLEALLKEHKMKASHGYTKQPDGILCFPGAALLILAREQGLLVNVTSPFIPVALLD